MLFQTYVCLFVLLNTKEDIWKNVLIKQISFPIGYHSRKKIHTMVVNESQICSFVFSRTNKHIEVFSRTNKHIEVWNNMRVSKY